MAPPKASIIPVKKRKRVVLTLKQKIEICKKIEAGVSRTTLMNEYNTGSTTLYDIYKQKAKLLSFVCNSDVKGIMEKTMYSTWGQI